MKLLAKYGLGALLLTLTASAFAAGADTAVNEVIESVFNKAGSIVTGSPFAAIGAGLFKIILGILISWKAIKIVLDISPFQMVIAELVQLILLAGIASFFLQPNTQKELADGFTSLANTAMSAAGGSIDVSSPASGIINTMGVGMQAIDNLWGALTPQEAEKKGFFDGVTAWLKTAWDEGPVGSILYGIAGVIYKGLITMAIIACTGIYIAIMIMTQIMINIGLMLAPLFVPWLLWPATAFLFEGWLRFMITTGIQKIVGAVLFGMTAGMLTQVGTLANTAAATAEFNAFAYAATAIILLIMVTMMVSVNSIAGGLVTGMPSVRFMPPAAMMTGGMSKGANTTAGKMAGGIGGAAQGAAAGFAAGKGLGAGARASLAATGAKSGAKEGWTTGGQEGAGMMAARGAGRIGGAGGSLAVGAARSGTGAAKAGVAAAKARFGKP
ncbi:type IV secretion system protein [Azonexus hydrophilus]|uniref:Type IV secretion system protein n=1 Tax=Azonexus hydrophilus TaxID=418702 RepID=A0ABZ2XQ57_9RHOO